MITMSNEIAEQLINELKNVLNAAEDMHAEINEARTWKGKPTLAERGEWQQTLDKAQAFLQKLN